MGMKRRSTKQKGRDIGCAVHDEKREREREKEEAAFS